MQSDNRGLRYNQGKTPFSYFPPDALFELGDHYAKGNAKYEERNWERGMKWSTCFDSLQRHLWAWWQGEDRDPENGSYHLTAVAWNALALLTYQLRGIGVDDRAKSGRQAEASGPKEESHSEGPASESFVQNANDLIKIV